MACEADHWANLVLTSKESFLIVLFNLFHIGCKEAIPKIKLWFATLILFQFCE